MENQSMTFWDHLDELRTRIINCLYVFFGGFILFYFKSDLILDFLRRPLFMNLPEEKRHLYYTGLFENFLVHLKVAGYASLIFFSPIYFMILWKFISPGLYEKERRNVLPFVIAGSFFFLLGSGFAYFVLFPAGVKYFMSYGTPAEVAWLTLENYIAVVMRILLGFGFCFQVPVIIVLLAKIGFITHETLAKQRRIAIVAVAGISAVVAPPDAISMLMLMAPLYLLFEGALLVIRFMGKAKSAS